jgi:ATP-dependent RNA helicase DHX37/DHR1
LCCRGTDLPAAALDCCTKPPAASFQPCSPRPLPFDSALRALCAFEAAGADEAFCRRNFLHFRNLREAAALYKQLARTLEVQQVGAARRAAAGSNGNDTPTAPAPAALVLTVGGLSGGGPLPPPPPAVLEVLRRALAAGWADQIARRIRSLEYIRNQEQQVCVCVGGWMWAGHRECRREAGRQRQRAWLGRRRRHAPRRALTPTPTPTPPALQGKRSRAVRYRSAAAVDDDVFLHPRSALHATAPELVAYTELVRTVKRPYMSGLTAVEPQWLAEVGVPLCAFSSPLAEPPPFYRPAADQVGGWGWELWWGGWKRGGKSTVVSMQLKR